MLSATFAATAATIAESSPPERKTPTGTSLIMCRRIESESTVRTWESTDSSQDLSGA